jgi:riboflavin synthase
VFSGIIEDLGTVTSLKPTDKGALITIGTRLPSARIKIGDSIACNGACLTVVAKGRGALSMDVSAETLRRTALGDLKPADPINLERSLTLGTLLNGHLVEKGSVAVDGISLTVFGVKGRRFTCALIPHTLKMTTLGSKHPGDTVNIESDLLAKYIERFVTQRNGGRVAKAQ